MFIFHFHARCDFLVLISCQPGRCRFLDGQCAVILAWPVAGTQEASPVFGLWSICSRTTCVWVWIVIVFLLGSIFLAVFGQQICGAVLVNLQSPMAKAYGWRANGYFMIFYAGTFTFRGLFCSDMFPLERKIMKNGLKAGTKLGPCCRFQEWRALARLGISRSDLWSEDVKSSQYKHVLRVVVQNLIYKIHIWNWKKGTTLLAAALCIKPYSWLPLS